jgi:hypothetical protein
LQRAQVRDYGDTGYQITCDDFRQLLRDYMTPEEVESYVAAPLGLRSWNMSEGWMFSNIAGDSFFDQDIVHIYLQMRPPLQHRIYQYAMSKWR